MPRSADEVCSLLASLGSASSCVFFSQVIISHARPGRRGSSRNKTSPRLLKRSDATFGFDGGDAPARNERSCIECIIFPARVRCAACLPYSTVTHAPPAVAGCPSCLAQAYESLANAHCLQLATACGVQFFCHGCDIEPDPPGPAPKADSPPLEPSCSTCHGAL